MKTWQKFIAISLSYLFIIGMAGLISAYSMERSLGDSSLEIIGAEESLTVDPEEEDLFNISGLYPGKTEKAKLIVRNDGVNPFELDIGAEPSGHDVLIDALKIKISDDDQVVYYDDLLNQMGDGKPVEIIEIDPDESKELTFALTLQTGHDNDTQGKTADMTWTFEASGDLPADPEGPATPTDPDPADPEGPTTPTDPDPADPFDDDPDTADPAVAEADPDAPEIVPLTDPVEVPPEAPDIDPDEAAAPVEEMVVDPEEPQVALEEEAEVAGFNYWWLLLLLIIPLLWLLYASSLLVLVPDQNGGYRVVARKIARPKDKMWHVNLEKQLDRHLGEYGFVVMDFRGRLLKDAGKAVYAGSTVLGSGRKRYALIGGQRMVTWADDLSGKANRGIG